MNQLIKVAAWSGTTRGHVIFVHGLGGHAYNTWRREKTTDSFWPRWLARDLKGVTVWTLHYSAPPTNWFGNALPLQDRATSVLELLLIEPRLAHGSIALVCHSLGGLVVKQILREAQSQSSHRPEAGILIDRIKAVVFFATPHTGSSHANLLNFLSLIFWPSVAATNLMRNDPNLRNLNGWYRNLSEISNKIFYETGSTAIGVIVDAGSADAGLLGVVPVPIEEDHFRICKPASRGDLNYAGTRDFLSKEIWNEEGNQQDFGKYRVSRMPKINRSWPSNLVPVLIRISLLFTVGLFTYSSMSKDTIRQTAIGDNTTQTGVNNGVVNIGNKSQSDRNAKK